MSLPTHLDNIDHPPIDSMSLSIKSAILPPLTLPTALLIVRTSVTIDTSQIIALGPELARRHPTHISQRLQLSLRRLVMMIVRAGVVGTVVAEEMYVAHFQLFDPLYFVGVIVHDRIYALAVAVARDRGEALRRWLGSQRRRDKGRFGHCGSSPRRCRWIKSRGRRGGVGGRAVELGSCYHWLIRRLIL